MQQPSSPIAVLYQQRSALLTEYAYEKEQFQRLTEAAGIGQKVRQGLAWFPLTMGRSYTNSLDQIVVEVSRNYTASDRTEHPEHTEDAGFYDIPDHQFEPNKPVCFFSEDVSGYRHKTGGMLHYMKFVAQVSFVDANKMVVVLPNTDALVQIQNEQRIGVQLFFDEFTYRLMFEALDAVINDKGGRLSELRDICHGTLPTSKFTFAPTRFPWLNTSQQAAVNEVLWAKDVAVIHGPPGTGKTTTLVEAVYETLRRENQVLVCAQSNMAVDWIAEKLVDRGLSVLRVGNPTRVTDKMLSFTYERQFENHPLYPELWAVRKALRDVYASRNGSADSRHQKIARLKDRANEIENNINQSIFNNTRVVACTLAGSANHILDRTKFGTLFIDEAAQALDVAR